MERRRFGYVPPEDLEEYQFEGCFVQGHTECGGRL